MAWVVENLVKNALDARSKSPGSIRVGLVWKRDERRVEFSVTDDGRGMTADERRHAFDPGFSTKRRGWGLGLALARRVVHEYHGGRIAIADSAPGKGTTVIVSLPLTPSTPS
jgi:signal transduction histidine kinase